jgi:hypothetical protein
METVMTNSIVFTKDKETKTKVRYTATGDVSGSIYVDKDSDLAVLDEIILQIN